MKWDDEEQRIQASIEGMAVLERYAKKYEQRKGSRRGAWSALALQVGLSNSAISAIATGSRPPGRTTLQKIKHAVQGYDLGTWGKPAQDVPVPTPATGHVAAPQDTDVAAIIGLLGELQPEQRRRVLAAAQALWG